MGVQVVVGGGTKRRAWWRFPRVCEKSQCQEPKRRDSQRSNQRFHVRQVPRTSPKRKRFLRQQKLSPRWEAVVVVSDREEVMKCCVGGVHRHVNDCDDRR